MDLKIGNVSRSRRSRSPYPPMPTLCGFAAELSK